MYPTQHNNKKNFKNYSIYKETKKKERKKERKCQTQIGLTEWLKYLSACMRP
jgi:uncharacterized protein YqiB (DUF1249 family)